MRHDFMGGRGVWCANHAALRLGRVLLDDRGMRGRLHHVIVDCPAPRALARFYSALLDLPVTYDTDDFAVVSVDDTTSGVAFQGAEDHRPPTWPDPAGHPFCLIPRPSWAAPLEP